MSEKIDQFCETLRQKLTAVETKMAAVRKTLRNFLKNLKRPFRPKLLRPKVS